MQTNLNAVALGLFVAVLSSAANAESSYYDPSNTAPGNDSGKTLGYQLYSTIGCPGKQLLEPGCPAETTESEPVAAAQPEPTPAPVTAALPAPVPAPVLMPAPVQVAKAETTPISSQANPFCNFVPMAQGSNPYLSTK